MSIFGHISLISPYYSLLSCCQQGKNGRVNNEKNEVGGEGRELVQLHVTDCMEADELHRLLETATYVIN